MELVDGFRVREHPNYVPWASMKSRCQNKKFPSYERYGEKGITVCDDWQHFKNFCLSMGLRPSLNHTIDRIDGSLGYNASNCRWATKTEQCLNRFLFSNNTSGYRGVKRKGDRWSAQFNYKNTSYRWGGTFATAAGAAEARDLLESLVLSGEDVSEYCERKARYDSATGVRGISKRPDGFLVRCTSEGVRKYIGLYQTLEDAADALIEWKKKNSKQN